MAGPSFATYFLRANSLAGCVVRELLLIACILASSPPASDESGGLISRFAWLAKLFATSPEQGAETVVYLASSPTVAETTGKYFYKRQPIAPPPVAQDDSVGDQAPTANIGCPHMTEPVVALTIIAA
jgi:hypothetical protein